MERITIETTQNVAIEYDIASIGERIVAEIIDLLIMGGYLFSIWRIVVLLGYTMGDDWLGIVFFFLSLPVVFYSLYFEILLHGQTPGKSVMKIKVMRTDGRQPTLGNYLMRWILRIADIDIGGGVVAIIAIIVNGKGQRLGDIAGGTLVIKLKSKQEIEHTAFEKVEETYVPIFPEVIKLSDKDASTIKEVLNLSVADNSDIALIEGKLAAKLKSLLGVNTTLGDRQFLQTVLKDYNIATGKL